MVYLDTNESIIEWQSEEFFIPYISPIDGKRHRYFPDFYIKHKNSKGKIVKTLIEVKPKSQCKEPKQLEGNITQKKKRRFLKEVQTWGINSAKWDAAKKWCKEKGANFTIITEDELRSMTGKAPYKSRRRKPKVKKKD